MGNIRACGCLILAASFAVTSAFPQKNAPLSPCKDVTRLDFKNMRIREGNQLLAFEDGVALTYDMPEMKKSGPPDWKAEIERDTIVQPVPGTTIRFLSVYASHLTGTGWNYRLVGYGCFDGYLRQVFSRNGLSLKIERLDDSGIAVTKLVKHGSLIATHWLYVWDKKRSTYVLSSTWSDNK